MQISKQLNKREIQVIHVFDWHKTFDQPMKKQVQFYTVSQIIFSKIYATI